jgi:hypothetical protein
MSLITQPNISDADAFYEQLLDAHSGLTRAQSDALNARLILLMANQIGDVKVLTQCLAAARDAATPSATHSDTQDSANGNTA